MNRENIILIGMPGSGKSTCGVLAAKALLKNFWHGPAVSGSWRKETSGHNWRKRHWILLAAEERTILSLDINATVVATGGSVVYSDKSMEHLKKSGKSFSQFELRHNGWQNKNITTRGVVVKRWFAQRYVQRKTAYVSKMGRFDYWLRQQYSWGNSCRNCESCREIKVLISYT